MRGFFICSKSSGGETTDRPIYGIRHIVRTEYSYPTKAVKDQLDLETLAMPSSDEGTNAEIHLLLYWGGRGGCSSSLTQPGNFRTRAIHTAALKAEVLIAVSIEQESHEPTDNV